MTRWPGLIGLGFGIALGLGSCGQLDLVQGKLDELCDKALPLAGSAMIIPTVGPYIASGIQIGCGTVEGLSRLKADSNSVAWVAEQIGLLRAALGR